MDSAILQIEETKNVSASENVLSNDTPADQLQFQNYPRNTTSTSQTQTTTGVKRSEKFSATILEDLLSQDDDDDEQVLIGGDEPGPGGVGQGVNAPFWQLAYFGQFFNVNTNQVLRRMIYSMIPIKYGSTGATYIERHIQNKADLYGPVWVNVTLIFTMAIFGNIADYFASSGQSSQWHSDWNKLVSVFSTGIAASTVLGYIILTPLVLWFFFWFRSCTNTFTLLETICTYGYSLSVYIPIAMLSVINFKIFRYFLVFTGSAMSGSVLLMSFAPVVKSDPAITFKGSYLVLLLILVAHAFIAFAFLSYFF